MGTGTAYYGVPNNPYPADIINLSLGGSGTCSTKTGYPAVITTLTTMGVLIVASAGNENGPVDVPANCAGVPGWQALRNRGHPAQLAGTSRDRFSLPAEATMSTPWWSVS